MTSVSTIKPSTIKPSTSASSATSPESETTAPGSVRLEMKPEGKATGHVDGGWWPRSRSLADELPALVEALTPRLGPVEWVSYHLGEWDSPPDAVLINGVAVRLGGYRLQGAASLDVIARDHRVTLLVVDPELDQRVAEAAMGTAATEGNSDDVATLLAQAAQGS